MLSRKHLTLSCRQTLRFIESADILYCKSQDYCTIIYINDGSSFVVSKTLFQLTKELNDPCFLRVSQSFLVNFSYIDHFDKLEKVVKLKNGEEIPFTLRIKDLIELVDAIVCKNAALGATSGNKRDKL